MSLKVTNNSPKLRIIKERLNDVLNSLPFERRDILLVGGIVRYITGIVDYYRDIDVMVHDDFEMPYGIFNMYGGVKITNALNTEIDIWKLRDHIIMCSDFSQVEETWRLSWDALYYDVEKDILYDKYFDRHLAINFANPIKKVEEKYINLKLSRYEI